MTHSKLNKTKFFAAQIGINMNYLSMKTFFDGAKTWFKYGKRCQKSLIHAKKSYCDAGYCHTFLDWY